MFSWITGGRHGHIEDETLSSGNGDATFIDVPETPAPVFAVRAFKHALFGTPEPVNPIAIASAAKPDAKPDTKAPATAAPDSLKPSTQRRLFQPSERQAQKEKEQQLDALNNSPTKAPSGILMTPGTANGRRKQVKFGEQVVDNEGKRSKYSKSGLPDNFPGKFPSPWTPKVSTPVDPKPLRTGDVRNCCTVDKKVESKFTEILDSSKISQKTSTAKPVAVRPKDGVDITMDLNLPQSASGRYWQEQYQSYSAQSEAETKRLIAKHKLAKEYARRKDDETVRLQAQLELERKKRQQREKDLERQVKEMRERLRGALAENSKVTTEMLALRLKEVATRSPVKNQDDRDTEKPDTKQVPVDLTPRRKSASFNTQDEDVCVWLDEKVLKGQDRRRRSHYDSRGAVETTFDQTGERHQHRLRTTRDDKLTRRSSIGLPDVHPVDGIRQKSPIRGDDKSPDRDLVAAIKSRVLEERKMKRRGLLSTPDATPHGSQTRDVPTSTTKPLVSRSPNIIVRSPKPNPGPTSEEIVTINTTAVLKPATTRKKPTSSSSLSRKPEFPIWDATAPLEALDMQASQPITPLSSHRKEHAIRTPRSAGVIKDVDQDRLDAAKERLAARRNRRKKTVIN